MAPNLQPGSFKIVSRTEGNPSIGVGLILPGIQFVRIDGHVKHWVFRKHEDGKYRLSVGGYPYTGVIDNKVAASVHFENEVAWEITYREHQDAYTIARADDPSVGWTVVDTQVEMKRIIQHPTFPPRFLPNQLFVLEQFE